MSTSSRSTARRVFVGLVLVSVALLALVATPFATALFLAAVLAGALYPLHLRLTRLVRGRESLSSGLLVVATALVLLVPVGGLTAVIVKEVAQGYRWAAQTVRSEGMNGLVERLPDRLEEPVRWLLDRLDLEEGALNEQLGSQATAQGGRAATAVTGFLSATGSLVLQGVMMLIALYFLLLDGARLVAWLGQVVPLEPGQTTELLLEFRKVSVAVLFSTLATAGVQALAAEVGYLIARVPQPIFFGALTFFVALIPAVGATSVCLAASVLLLATGHEWMALFLAIWGLLVVGLVDNVVKPLLVKRGMSLHGAVVFFALLGGLGVFGPVGLLLGPMVVAFFLALVRIHQRQIAPPAPPPPPDPAPAAESPPPPPPAPESAGT
ncbi:MAG TPA: AI-2E family transporter [Myxococcaceae bacterium]|jgi:predicted PurR-regulated permease PerM